MMDPKLALFLVGVVAFGATQLVDSDSTIAGIANSDNPPVLAQPADAQQSGSSIPGSAAGEDGDQRLNFDQPLTSSATLKDFYSGGEGDDDFAATGPRDVVEDEQDPEPAAFDPSPAPSGAAKLARNAKPASTRAVQQRARARNPAPVTQSADGKPAEPWAKGASVDPNLTL